jgi:hypothetical protein
MEPTADALLTKPSTPNTPILGRFEPELWSVSAQCRLLQHTAKSYEVQRLHTADAMNA